MPFANGPWQAEPQGGKGSWIRGADGEWVALSCGKDDITAEANAKLISAAPDLLFHLEVAIDALEGFGISHGAIPEAKKVIASAKGKLR